MKTIKTSAARVVPEILTDGSIVFNVIDGDGEAIAHPPSQQEAQEICDAYNSFEIDGLEAFRRSAQLEQFIKLAAFMLDRLYDRRNPTVRKVIHSDDMTPDGRTVRRWIQDLLTDNGVVFTT